MKEMMPTATTVVKYRSTPAGDMRDGRRLHLHAGPHWHVPGRHVHVPPVTHPQLQPPRRHAHVQSGEQLHCPGRQLHLPVDVQLHLKLAGADILLAGCAKWCVVILE